MKRNEIIVHEHKKGVRAVKYNQKPQPTIEPPKPRNPVAKNSGAAIGGGAAGAHKNEKKASQSVRGQKHKNAELAEMDKSQTPPGRDGGSSGGKEYRGKPLTAKQMMDKAHKAMMKTMSDTEKVDKGWRNPNLKEYGDTAKGQKMLTKVQKRAVDRMIKAADKGDAKNAGKNQDTANRAWERMSDKDVEEGRFGRSGYYNPMDYERDQQRQMDYDKREFKRQELQHELGHEDDPDFERKLRQQQMDKDRGPWYLKVNGKILKAKGEPKVFDWKKGANNYALAILKNKPELQGKIFLTKKSEDDVSEMGNEVGKITKVDPNTKKATVTKADGSSMEIDSTSLKPTADGKMQMDTPDTDQLKTGTSVVSTEDMMEPPTDSQSPIPGDNDHDEISKLLVHRLRRLAGL